MEMNKDRNAVVKNVVVVAINVGHFEKELA